MELAQDCDEHGAASHLCDAHVNPQEGVALHRVIREEEPDLHQLTELLIGLVADTKINEEMVGLDNDELLEVCDYLPDVDTDHRELERHQLVEKL